MSSQEKDKNKEPFIALKLPRRQNFGERDAMDFFEALEKGSEYSTASGGGRARPYFLSIAGTKQLFWSSAVALLLLLVCCWWSAVNWSALLVGLV